MNVSVGHGGEKFSVTFDKSLKSYFWNDNILKFNAKD